MAFLIWLPTIPMAFLIWLCVFSVSSTLLGLMALLLFFRAKYYLKCEESKKRKERTDLALPPPYPGSVFTPTGLERKTTPPSYGENNLLDTVDQTFPKSIEEEVLDQGLCDVDPILDSQCGDYQNRKKNKSKRNDVLSSQSNLLVEPVSSSSQRSSESGSMGDSKLAQLGEPLCHRHVPVIRSTRPGLNESNETNVFPHTIQRELTSSELAIGNSLKPVPGIGQKGHEGKYVRDESCKALSGVPPSRLIQVGNVDVANGGKEYADSNFGTSYRQMLPPDFAFISLKKDRGKNRYSSTYDAVVKTRLGFHYDDKNVSEDTSYRSSDLKHSEDKTLKDVESPTFLWDESESQLNTSHKFFHDNGDAELPNVELYCKDKTTHKSSIDSKSSGLPKDELESEEATKPRTFDDSEGIDLPEIESDCGDETSLKVTIQTQRSFLVKDEPTKYGKANHQSEVDLERREEPICTKSPVPPKEHDKAFTEGQELLNNESGKYTDMTELKPYLYENETHCQDGFSTLDLRESTGGWDNFKSTSTGCSVYPVSNKELPERDSKKRSQDNIELAVIQMLKEENEAWKKKSLCIICLEKHRKIVFLPCGHLICCRDCAWHESIIKCPVCRMKIEYKVDVR